MSERWRLKKVAASDMTLAATWYGQWGSNPHGSLHRNLNPARLPIPPCPHVGGRTTLPPFLNQFFLEEALIQCVCGILRKFCTIILLRFLEINTIIPAKSRRILAQNFFAICFCRFHQSFLNPAYHTRVAK